LVALGIAPNIVVAESIPVLRVPTTERLEKIVPELKLILAKLLTNSD
jgi:hypothetical protein